MSDFNLTAQLILQGPTNIVSVRNRISNQLQGISARVNIAIDPQLRGRVATTNRSLSRLNRTLVSIAASGTDATTAIKKLGIALNQLHTATQRQASVQTQQNSAFADTTSNMEAFGKSSALAIRRYAAFTLATTIIYGFLRATSAAIVEAVKFERELVKVAQVSGKTIGELKGLTSEITRLATSWGVSSTELVEVSKTLSQAGLSIYEVKGALEAISQASLAPTFSDMNKITEVSIAVLRQFKLETSDLVNVLGSINAVAGKFAVSADDIGVAIRRAGGVFAATSGDFEDGKQVLNEFIALFTSVRSTTRETAETIATGLRTIFTRIQRGSTIDYLKQFGVELQDVDGKFIGTYKAVEKLSDVLNKIDPRDVRFSAIIEQLGGFRQVGKVIPLIQQFAVAQEALKVAQSGQDSIAKDAAMAQKTLAIQLIQVREEFLALLRDISQTESFKLLTTTILKMADSLIKLADAFKPILPFLTIMLGVRGISAGAGFLKGFTKNIKHFSAGGFVPGTGSGDTVPAMLEPGEFVIRKSVTKRMQKEGVLPQKMNKGDLVDKRIAADSLKFSETIKTGKGPGKKFIDDHQLKEYQGTKTANRYGAVFLRPTGQHSSFSGVTSGGVSFILDIASIQKETSNRLEKTIAGHVKKGVEAGASIIHSTLNLENSPLAISKGMLDKIGTFDNIMGRMFEGALTSASGSWKDDDTNETNFDYPFGLTSSKAKEAFAMSGEMPIDAKATFNPDSVKSMMKKIDHVVTKKASLKKQGYTKKIAGTIGSNLHPARRIKRSSGGPIPALLTPGEFVVTKPQVADIGLNNLRNMNSGVTKFARGGSVGFGIQRMAYGDIKNNMRYDDINDEIDEYTRNIKEGSISQQILIKAEKEQVAIIKQEVARGQQATSVPSQLAPIYPQSDKPVGVPKQLSFSATPKSFVDRGFRVLEENRTNKNSKPPIKTSSDKYGYDVLSQNRTSVGQFVDFSDKSLLTQGNNYQKLQNSGDAGRKAATSTLKVFESQLRKTGNATIAGAKAQEFASKSLKKLGMQSRISAGGFKGMIAKMQLGAGKSGIGSKIKGAASPMNLGISAMMLTSLLPETTAQTSKGVAGFKGGLQGAASGAAIGAMFGPWGIAIGAAVGGINGLVTALDSVGEMKSLKRLDDSASIAVKALTSVGSITTGSRGLNAVADALPSTEDINGIYGKAASDVFGMWEFDKSQSEYAQVAKLSGEKLASSSGQQKLATAAKKRIMEDVSSGKISDVSKIDKSVLQASVADQSSFQTKIIGLQKQKERAKFDVDLYKGTGLKSEEFFRGKELDIKRAEEAMSNLFEEIAFGYGPIIEQIKVQKLLDEAYQKSAKKSKLLSDKILDFSASTKRSMSDLKTASGKKSAFFANLGTLTGGASSSISTVNQEDRFSNTRAYSRRELSSQLTNSGIDPNSEIGKAALSGKAIEGLTSELQTILANPNIGDMSSVKLIDKMVAKLGDVPEVIKEELRAKLSESIGDRGDLKINKKVQANLQNAVKDFSSTYKLSKDSVQLAFKEMASIGKEFVSILNMKMIVERKIIDMENSYLDLRTKNVLRMAKLHDKTPDYKSLEQAQFDKISNLSGGTLDTNEMAQRLFTLSERESSLVNQQSNTQAGSQTSLRIDTELAKVKQESNNLSAALKMAATSALGFVDAQLAEIKVEKQKTADQRSAARGFVGELSTADFSKRLEMMQEHSALKSGLAAGQFQGGEQSQLAEKGFNRIMALVSSVSVEEARKFGNEFYSAQLRGEGMDNAVLGDIMPGLFNVANKKGDGNLGMMKFSEMMTEGNLKEAELKKQEEVLIEKQFNLLQYQEDAAQAQIDLATAMYNKLNNLGVSVGGPVSYSEPRTPNLPAIPNKRSVATTINNNSSIQPDKRIIEIKLADFNVNVNGPQGMDKLGLTEVVKETLRNELISDVFKEWATV